MRDATIAGLESIKERGGGSWVALPVPVYPRLLVKGRGRVLGAEQPPLDEGPTVINGDYRGQLGPKLRDGAINVSVATALFTRYLRVIYAELYFFIFFVFAGGPGCRILRES